MRGANNYAAIAEGYINIPEDGVYYLSSRMEQVWIDNKLVINNEGFFAAGFFAAVLVVAFFSTMF